jgi:hypothetical protein
VKNLALYNIFLCLLFLISRSAWAQTNPQNAVAPAVLNLKPEIYVTWTDQKIKIDGRLDDEAWQRAVPYEPFFFQQEPQDREPSSEKTRVMVLQDEQMIYFGIQCHDSEPDKIFASTMRRDTNIWRDDVVELLIDTFRDNRNCYAFVTNALGVQGDAIVSDQGNHINLQWECVVYMDAQKNDRGWSAEFAIPFKSLKYENGEVVEWGFNITREIKHRQEVTYLAPIPRGLGHNGKFRGELWGRLTNIHPPQGKLNIEVNPYVLGGRTQIFGDAQTEKIKTNAGVDFKYDVTPQLALDLTYKTDFAQAESEEEVVNVTRFNIMRAEKRDFFLQSAGLYQFGPGTRMQPNFSLFDSRTIGITDGQRVPLWGGGKLTGRIGRYSLAALTLQSENANLDDGAVEPSTNFTAVRLKRDISTNSHIGMMVLNKQADVRYSRTAGIDGAWNVTDEIRLDGSIAGSFSPEHQTRNMAGDLAFVLNKEWIDVNIRHTSIDTLFNPEMGFVMRPNIRSTAAMLCLTKWLNNRFLENVSVTSNFGYITDHHQTLQTRTNDLSISAIIRSGDSFQAGVVQSYDFLLQDDDIRGIPIRAGVYNARSQYLTLTSYRARPFQASTSYQWGELYDGDGQTFKFSGTGQFSKHLITDLIYTYNRLELARGSLEAHVVATRWTLCFTTDLFAKAYVQWNSADERFSYNFLIDYSYRPKSHLYFVYNENRDTFYRRVNDRLILLKMTYLLQI